MPQPVINEAAGNINPAPTSLEPHITDPNSYGVYRVYPGGTPSYVPDNTASADDMADAPTFKKKPMPIWTINKPRDPAKPPPTFDEKLIQLFPNKSVYILMDWYYRSGSSTQGRTHEQLNSLVHQVLRNPDFNPNELQGFRAAKEADRIDNFHKSIETLLPVPDAWKKSDVRIPMCPPTYTTFDNWSGVPKFTTSGMNHRSLVSLIESALSEPAASQFHLFPFEEHWRPKPGQESRRIYSELYNSQVFIDEHMKIKAAAQSMGVTMETVVLGLMLWSDATHLAQFGVASLWPIYVFFANQSKYTRGKPSSFSAHHLAYLPKLGTEFEEMYSNVFDEPPTKETITQAKRELIHAIWLILLDEKFVHAYVYGFEWKYWDNVTRLSFPRVFTHSMDYPEKILLACIKFLGRCPCPVCLIRRSHIPLLGTVQDDRVHREERREDTHAVRFDINSIREQLYLKGLSLESTTVQTVLGTKSLTPIRSAFSQRLSEHGFDFYSVIVPDQMHEFELGVWKAVFVHLLRLLFAHDSEQVIELNFRYRVTPTFGRDTIRKFPKKASAMEKLAARDFEDLLQCAFPAFDGLLPAPHNKIVLDLLFELATWHGLAKLRSHQPESIAELATSTKRLGTALRRFVSVTCEAFDTRQLEKEVARSGRRKAAAAAKAAAAGSKKGKEREVPSTKGNEDSTEGPKKARFNLLTSKLHALGHYAEAIPKFGTTDNISTQLGEQEHKRGKTHYPSVSKQDHEGGIAKLTRRERILHIIRQSAPPETKGKKKNTPMRASVPFDVDEKLPKGSPNAPYQMSHETKKECRIHLDTWLRDLAAAGDPIAENFQTKLKTHLLFRFQGCRYDGDETGVTDEDLRKVVIIDNAIFRHKVLRINYTTYDQRREQDSLNPRTHADILLLAPDQSRDAHPYWYAHIVAVCHARVVYHGGETFGAQPEDIDFLLIRWYGRATTPTTSGPTSSRASGSRLPAGWASKSMHRVGFVDEKKDNSPAFGFLDPKLIIRGLHLIPDFKRKRSNNGIPTTIARPESDMNTDWNYFYVNMFVDRDMFMRYRGGGVGHKSTRRATDFFLNDRDKLDLARRADPDVESQDPEEAKELSEFATVFQKNNPKVNLSNADGSSLIQPTDDEEEDEMEEDDDWEVTGSDSEAAEEEGYEGDDLLGAEDGETVEDEYEVIGFGRE
ncbi:hypothetical protein DFP72DRAFT_834947 [Ephemerocybe angulata]|uniref:Uncharacterized protein n=1 Tax=Ephemerocybe angulata TaxID=980116 RepID=A0A8H6H7T8_9AGAR|nr:hypothetical protein DFP72DRAFT_834947 [Tulosesus angulatus]